MSTVCNVILQSTGGIKECGMPIVKANRCARHMKPVAASVYEKVSARLAQFGLKLTHGKKEYVNSKTPCEFTCARGHVTFGAVENVCNARRRHQTMVGCAVCRGEGAPSELDRVKEKLELLGHEFVSAEKCEPCHYKIIYVCGCRLDKNERVGTRTNSSNILGEVWGGCGACSQERSGAKHTIEEVAAAFDKHGLLLLATEYNDNRQMLEFVCSCGEEGLISYHDMMTGRGCGKCKTAKYIKTCQDKYGCDNAFQAPEIQEKSKQTNMDKRGVQYPMQDISVRALRDETVKNSSGLDYAFHSDQSKKQGAESIVSIYGSSTYPLSTPGQVQNMNALGTLNPMQNADVFDKQQKSANKFKTYTMPSGRRVHIQGYESFALDHLLTIDKEDNILVDRRNMPVIYYKYEGRTHRYFPDIYVRDPNPSEPDLVVEVKSMYTLTDDLAKNRCKFRYADASNLAIIILVFDGKNKKPVREIIEDAQFDEFETEEEYKYEELDREIVEQNCMMYDEYLSYARELKDRDIEPDQNDLKNDSDEKSSSSSMSNTPDIRTMPDLQTVYEQVKAGTRPEDDLRAFGAHVLKELAVKLGAQFGVKQNICKDILIKKIMHPEFYAKGSPIRYAYHDKLDHIRAQGHTDVTWSRPKIHYVCKFCGQARTTELKRITETWRMCNLCSNKERNSERAKMKLGMKYKKRAQE